MTGADDDQVPTVEDLRSRLQAAEEALSAIKGGDVDAIVVHGPTPQVFTLRGAEDVYQAFVETMSEGALLLDEEGTVLYANARLADLLAVPLESLIGSTWASYSPTHSVMKALSSPHRTAQDRVRRSDGSLVEVLVSARSLVDSAPERICVVVTDLTELLRGQRAQRELASLVDGTDEAVIGLSGDGTVTSVNAGAIRMLGLDPVLVVGAPVRRVLGPAVARIVEEAVRTGRSTRIDVLDQQLADGVDFVSLTASPVTDANGRLSGVSLLGHDVTARHRAEQRLQHQSSHDELTGLANRTKLLQDLTERLAQKDATQLAVLFIDIDRFKRINDTQGHDGGDELLRAIAARIRNTMRPNDLAARVGGDEFVMVCDTETSDHREARTIALSIAERLANHIREPVTGRAGRAAVTPSASIGVALSGDAREGTAEALIHSADAAMYLAKNRGRSQTQVFDDELREETRRRDHDIAHARSVIDERRLVVVYQPIVSLGDRSVVGHEALLRWQHPVRGLTGPMDLLDVADDAGMAVAIGEWVAETAIADLAWRTRADGYSGDVHVNVAAAQIGRGVLTDRLLDIVRRHGIEPRRVCVEVTEGISIDRQDAVRELHGLADAGFVLALDDFGTGYASLTHLQGLPLRLLKIDKAFVGKMNPRMDRPPMVAAIIELAAALGLQVVAEGVETAEQEDVLRRLGCAFGQGYRYGRPAQPQAGDETSRPG